VDATAYTPSKIINPPPMASAGSSRSLAERISDDPWPHDRDAAEEVFTARPRKPKRKQEPEIDSEYLYTPWVDSMKVKGDETKEQRWVLTTLSIVILETLKNFARRLHDEIVAYMTYVQPTTQEETTRGQVYDFVEKTVKGRFNRGEVSLFGSVAHDLCLPDGLVAHQTYRNFSC
jgi:non-canonical poly(A) RNA polymerase PAPD5/7